MIIESNTTDIYYQINLLLANVNLAEFTGFRKKFFQMIETNSTCLK